MLQHKEVLTKLGLTAYPTTDKVYIVRVVPTSTKEGWNVQVSYGKRNNVGHTYNLTEPLCYEEAMELHDKTVRGKLKKGYIIETQCSLP